MWEPSLTSYKRLGSDTPIKPQAEPYNYKAKSHASHVLKFRKHQTEEPSGILYQEPSGTVGPGLQAVSLGEDTYLLVHRSQPIVCLCYQGDGLSGIHVKHHQCVANAWSGDLLGGLELPPPHSAAKSQVTFSELPHNSSFWHELSATPEPFLGTNYMSGRCEAWGQPTWRPHEEVPKIRDW